MRKKSSKKPVVSKAEWRTLRAVVTYRTNRPSVSERDFVRHVEWCLRTTRAAHPSDFTDSTIHATGFNASVARMDAVRPQRLRATIKALEAGVARLKKL